MKRLSVLFLCICIGLPAAADVIYRNAGPRNELMPYSDRAFPQMLADSFTLQSGSTTVTQVHWWGGYGHSPLPNVDQFVISIYGDQNGTPSIDPIFETSITSYTRALSSPPDRFNGDTYAYSAFIGNVSLQAGRRYYLSITNNTYGVGSGWAWSDGCHNCSDSYFRTDPNGPWRLDGLLLNLAFYLTDDPTPIPEPSSLMLLSVGMAGLAIRRLARR